jgi:hypothetical protein
METLRRACLVVESDEKLAQNLLLRLTARALDAEAKGAKDWQPWFDAAYFVAASDQLGAKFGFDPGASDGCTGYAWLKKAIALSGNNAEVQYAAALTTHPAMHKGTHETYENHLRNAAAWAEKNSLAEKNLATHCKAWNISLDDLRKKGASADSRK